MHACTVPALLRPLSIASRTAVLRPTRPAAARLRRPVVHRRARAVPRVAAEGDAAGGNSSSQSAEASSPAVFSSTGEVLRYACTAAVGLSVLGASVRVGMGLPATLTALTLLDYFGTMVFSCGGSIIAGENDMDLMGSLLLGTCSGIGGGTLRDVLLGRLPVFWVEAVQYLFICLAAAAVTFAFRRQASHLLKRQPYRSMMLWGDTIGLAAFATIGAHVATTMGLHPLTACVSSIFSGTFGGFIRDVCCRQPPMVLTREVYAAAAFCGGAAYCATWACSQDAQLAILAALCSTVLMRATAANFNLGLPRWSD